jgi:hypothetical protein
MIITMQLKLIQIAGLLWTIIYFGLIVWLYVSEPRSIRDVATSASVVAGTYKVDQARFDAGLDLFKRDEFRAARNEWSQADPAQRDARTQFYIAYSFYREGWGRVSNNDELYKRGLESINRAIELSANQPLTVEDPDLKIHSASELKSEIEKGLERDWSDLNPLKLFRERK